MRLLQKLRMRLMVTRRRTAATQLDEELRYHLERETAENIAAGMAPDEARYVALRAFGNPLVIRDHTRATWSWMGLEALLRDVRFAFRALRRTPGFTAIAVVVMALGIGVNVALFAVVHGVLLTPLPFRDPQQLVMLYESGLHAGDGQDFNPVAGGVYEAWKKQNQTLSSMALVRGSRVLLSGGGGQLSEKLNSGEFSWDLLPTLGVEPALGRNFAQAEDSPAAGGTVLLSWGLWQRRFGADPQILNRTILIDDRPFTVIGVMPAWFRFPDASTQLWVPIYHERDEALMTSFSRHMLGVVGRLRAGATPTQAAADLTVISGRIHDDHRSDPFVYQEANSRALLDDLVGDIRGPLYVLLGATACVLLIACLNVANLLVARAAARRKDLAIRTALGSGWLRLMRERMLENLLLSVFGGLLGLGFAAIALGWLVRARQDISRIENIHMDAAAVLFAAALVALCAALSGAISAFGTSGRTILSALHESSRGLGGEGARTGLRRMLLAVEVSLTVVLLIAAGLLLKSYERLSSADLGCLTRNVLTLHMGIPDMRYPIGAARVNFYDKLLDRVRALPGVSASGFVDLVPGQGAKGEESLTIVEHPALPQGKSLSANHHTADADYFEAIGIPIVQGRSFNPALRLEDADEVVVDESFVQAFFPEEDPVGKHLLMKGRRYVIVGVAGATRFAVGEPPRATVYTSLRAGFESVGTIVVRSRQDVTALAVPIERIVAEMDPDLAVSDVLTMEQLLGESTLPAGFNATLLAVFATLSLLLAAAGLFGVLSYIAAQRTREIGIRIALGAQREQVLRLMLFDGVRPALAGLAVGLAAGLGAARLLRSLLYETRPLDPAVFGAVALLLLAVAAAASVLPAWRASRVDAIEALRAE